VSLAQPPPEEKEMMTSLVEGALENILVPPEGAVRSGCPYTPLNACLACVFIPLPPLSPAITQILSALLYFILPPLDPLISTLPSFLDYLMGTIKSVIPLLEDPETLSKLLGIALPIIVENPYSIIKLIDMVLNPYSLRIVNPFSPQMQMFCASLFRGISPQDCVSSPYAFSQSLIANFSGELSSWLSGLRGVLGIIPGLIPLLGAMKGYL
jgi:hypothetical protein